MTYEHLVVETRQDFVSEITLNRPDRLNTFNSLMAEELYSALMAADSQREVRVVLLKGAGKASAPESMSMSWRGKPLCPPGSGSNGWNVPCWRFHT